MPFTSLDFAIFFGFVLFINWHLKSRHRLYPPFLLLTNLIFYGLGAPKFLPLLIIVGMANWGAAKLMRPDLSIARCRFILMVDIVFCLFLLAFFKYFEFFLTTLESLGLTNLNGLFNLPEIIYPVGLSFFTFQGLSLAIDQYRDRDKPPLSIMDVLIFVSFFPTILSGPIQRADTFIRQLKSISTPGPEDFNLALTLILSGLFKKVAMSSYLSEHIVRGVFQVPESYSAIGILGGIYGYSAQIYLDFSGYSDLALGVALLMGFNVGQNFDRPYLTTNIRDFWKRWHISLSNWLRDYLYIPLGGNRRGSKLLNLILTQTLGGLWHGAHLRYLIWGFGHGLALAITHIFHDRRLHRERAYDIIGFKSWQRPQPRFPGLIKLLSFLFTINFVSFMWILFRAENTDRALEIFLSVFNWSKPGLGAPLMVWFLVGLTIFSQWTGETIRATFMKIQNHMSVPLLSLWCAIWVIIIIKLGPEGVLPFIYFQY